MIKENKNNPVTLVKVTAIKDSPDSQDFVVSCDCNCQLKHIMEVLSAVNSELLRNAILGITPQEGKKGTVGAAMILDVWIKSIESLMHKLQKDMPLKDFFEFSQAYIAFMADCGLRADAGGVDFSKVSALATETVQ